jgi:hypothetical protein
VKDLPPELRVELSDWLNGDIKKEFLNIYRRVIRAEPGLPKMIAAKMALLLTVREIRILHPEYKKVFKNLEKVI